MLLIQRIILRIVFMMIGKVMGFLSRYHHRFKNQLYKLLEGFNFQFVVQPKNLCLQFKKINGSLYWSTKKANSVDLELYFKNQMVACEVFALQKSFPNAYAQHLISFKGHIANGLVIYRMFNILLTCILPVVFVNHLFKEKQSQRTTSLFVFPFLYIGILTPFKRLDL